MESASRHQCLIYAGPPSRYLPALAETLRQKLASGFRCLYLNSPTMVAGMRSYLAAAGVDVELETNRRSLILSADQSHLIDGVFHVDGMIDTLEQSLLQALEEGYSGLFATGDMTWELGPDQDLHRLARYEVKLEELFRKHPQLTGICQYHAGTLPREFLKQGLLSHASIYVNETLSLIRPEYVRQASGQVEAPAGDEELEALLDRLIPGMSS